MQHQIRISDFGIALSVVYILKLVKDGCYMLTFILFIVYQQIEGMSQKYPSQYLESGSYCVFTARLIATSRNLSNITEDEKKHR